MRVTGTGRRRSTAYAREHRFQVGAPVAFDAAADRVSALEYALGALASDLLTTFTELCRRRRLDVGPVEAVVTGELDNPLTVLRVVGEEGGPGLSTITLKVYAGSSEAADVLEAVWREAQSLSPLAVTFRAAVALDLELRIHP